jgi:hypothetical protein
MYPSNPIMISPAHMSGSLNEVCASTMKNPSPLPEATILAMTVAARPKAIATLHPARICGAAAGMMTRHSRSANDRPYDCATSR